MDGWRNNRFVFRKREKKKKEKKKIKKKKIYPSLQFQSSTVAYKRKGFFLLFFLFSFSQTSITDSIITTHPPPRFRILLSSVPMRVSPDRKRIKLHKFVQADKRLRRYPRINLRSKYSPTPHPPLPSPPLHPLRTYYSRYNVEIRKSEKYCLVFKYSAATALCVVEQRASAKLDAKVNTLSLFLLKLQE